MADARRTTEELVREFLAADAWAQRSAVSVSHVAPGEVTVHLTVTSEMLNGHGTAHGAVLFTLADVAFAMACNSHAHDAVGRSCTIEYLAPAFEDEELTAVATERVRSGRSGIYDIAVTRASNGEVLAEMRGNSRELPAKSPAQ